MKRRRTRQRERERRGEGYKISCTSCAYTWKMLHAARGLTL